MYFIFPIYNLSTQSPTTNLPPLLKVPYRRCALAFLNIVFGRNAESRVWWAEALSPLLSNLFSFPSRLIPPTKDYRKKILFEERGLRKFVDRFVIFFLFFFFLVCR